MRSDYQVRDPDIEKILESLGNMMRNALDGTGYGFSLLIFTFGEGGNMFYTSNARREDMIRAMYELKQKFREN